MGEEIESASGLENRSFSIEGNLMRNRGNLLRIKLSKAHQDIGDATAPLPQHRFFRSVNTLIDHDNYGEESHYRHRKKKSSLAHETNQNAFSGSDEHVKEEAPQVTKNCFTCSVCRKDFKSIKSLSGHMRCHPEREWRGIQPPSAVKNSTSSTISESGGQKMDDQNDSATTIESLASDHLPPLSNWSTKRNRNIAAVRTLKVANHLLRDLQDEEIEAIHNLLMLANGDTNEWGQVKKEQVGEGSNAKTMDFEWENSQIQEQGYASGNVNGSESEAMEKDYRTGIKQRPEEMNFNGSAEIRRIPKKRKFQRIKSVYRKRKSVANARHICRTCNKSYPTHQALGGHRASHKKGCLMSVAEVGESSVADDGEDDRYASSDVAQTKSLPSEAETVHRCKTCEKTFSSGQALGGHQRCHWLGAVEAPMISDRLQERRLHNFDLNEVPMDEGCSNLELHGSSQLA